MAAHHLRTQFLRPHSPTRPRWPATDERRPDDVDDDDDDTDLSKTSCSRTTTAQRRSSPPPAAAAAAAGHRDDGIDNYGYDKSRNPGAMGVAARAASSSAKTTRQAARRRSSRCSNASAAQFCAHFSQRLTRPTRPQGAEKTHQEIMYQASLAHQRESARRRGAAAAPTGCSTPAAATGGRLRRRRHRLGAAGHGDRGRLSIANQVRVFRAPGSQRRPARRLRRLLRSTRTWHDTRCCGTITVPTMRSERTFAASQAPRASRRMFCCLSKQANLDHNAVVGGPQRRWWPRYARARDRPPARARAAATSSGARAPPQLLRLPRRLRWCRGARGHALQKAPTPWSSRQGVPSHTRQSEYSGGRSCTLSMRAALGKPRERLTPHPSAGRAARAGAAARLHGSCARSRRGVP